MELCSLCSDESSHSGHQPDATEQHLTRSLDRTSEAGEDVDGCRSVLIFCKYVTLWSVSDVQKDLVLIEEFRIKTCFDCVIVLAVDEMSCVKHCQ